MSRRKTGAVAAALATLAVVAAVAAATARRSSRVRLSALFSRRGPNPQERPVTENRTIRGSVRGVSYEAALKPADWPVVEGRGGEWHVTTQELPTFTLAAGGSLVWEPFARTAIEMELERRLTR